MNPEYNHTEQIEKNYEGNESALLFSRLSRPEIKKQVCDLMFQMDSLYTDDGKEKDENGKEVWPIDEFAPTYEDQEVGYDKRLQNIQEVTYINFNKNPLETHNSWEMFPHSINPITGQGWTSKELSMVEAHEKGHNIRDYDGPQYDEYFHQGFDLSKITLPSERIKHIKETWLRHREDSKKSEEITDEKVIRAVIKGNLNGMEIAERMNQLKNYFGFEGTEEFTKAHLDIAREHYIPDTAMDNEMTAFFQVITPETEDKFLELINNSGI